VYVMRLVLIKETTSLQQILLGIERGQEIAGGGQARSKRSSAWKQRRRKTEWKVRWLELRLKDLNEQAAHYTAELSTLRSAAPAASAAAEKAVSACSAEAAQGADVKQSGLEEAPATHTPSQDGLAVRPLKESAGEAVGVSMRPRRRHERLQAEELAAQSILDHPFFQALAGLRPASKVCIPKCQSCDYQMLLFGSECSALST
jgi:hypothetical protein